jgi:hypothetical protein
MFFSSRILQPVFGGDAKLVVLGIMGIGTPFNFIPGLLPSVSCPHLALASDKLISQSFGSKRILLVSALGTCLFAILLGTGLNLHNQVLSGVSVIGFVIAFSIGLAPIGDFPEWIILAGR